MTLLLYLLGLSSVVYHSLMHGTFNTTYMMLSFTDQFKGTYFEEYEENYQAIFRSTLTEIAG